MLQMCGFVSFVNRLHYSCIRIFYKLNLKLSFSCVGRIKQILFDSVLSLMILKLTITTLESVKAVTVVLG